MPQLLNRTTFGGLVLIIAGIWLLISAGCTRQRSNEDYAIGAMETIRKSEEAFKSKNGHYGTLDELAASEYGIPSRVQRDYEFTVRVTPTSYIAVAIPTRAKERSLSLYLDQSGIIRGMFKNGEEADVKDPPLRGYGINPSLTPLPLQ
jgi:hypothetical protein